MITITIEYKDDSGSEHSLTRRYAEDVSDEVLSEAIIDLKNRVTEKYD